MLTVLIACKTEESKDLPAPAPNYEAVSLLGDTLRSKTPSEAFMQRYEEKKKNYMIWMHSFGMDGLPPTKVITERQLRSTQTD